MLGEIGADHARSGADHRYPPRRAVRLRELFQYPDAGRNVHLAAAEHARDEHVEYACGYKLIDDCLSYAAFPLSRVAVIAD